MNGSIGQLDVESGFPPGPPASNNELEELGRSSEMTNDSTTDGIEPRIKVTMMLADAARVADGKLYILGGGWSQTGPGPVPFAIALDVKVPWHLANRKHQFKFELVDDSGGTIAVSDSDGDSQPLCIEAELEVGRPPGIKVGTSLDTVLVIQVPAGIPLAPGRRYEWRLMVNDECNEDWTLPFSVRALSLAEAA
jgi:hypothetical protein